jgi:hypothetical protein
MFVTNYKLIFSKKQQNHDASKMTEAEWNVDWNTIGSVTNDLFAVLSDVARKLRDVTPAGDALWHCLR